MQMQETAARTRGAWQRIEAGAALKMLFDAVEQDRPFALFDTRDAQSYAGARLPGAVSLAERDIGDWVLKLPKDRLLVIYCYHGNASQVFAQTFADFGFQAVYSVDGGFHDLAHAWQAARDASA